MRDQERVGRLVQSLREQSLDAFVCALPHNVLLLTGYWPVIGTSVAMVTREGQVALLVPEDEKQLAEKGWADRLGTFNPASLSELFTTAQALREPLRKTLFALKLGNARIGAEMGEESVAAPYSALHVYGQGLNELLSTLMPLAHLQSATDSLARARAVLTSTELERVRLACEHAEGAFEQGAELLQAGVTEPEVVNSFHAPLGSLSKRPPHDTRAGGWVWCMSGPNAAQAYAAYAMTRGRVVQLGDLVMVHCNSYVDGYWTDITRTFSVGPPGQKERAMYEAVLAARESALQVVKPGASAAAVDFAARQILEQRGFGKEFKHAAGHGVGFGAIDHNARPRLHPKSPDVLETGMVFNLEPAIYLSGFGGLRQCEMVAVTSNGAELLTPFQNTIENLSVL